MHGIMPSPIRSSTWQLACVLLCVLHSVSSVPLSSQETANASKDTWESEEEDVYFDMDVNDLDLELSDAKAFEKEYKAYLRGEKEKMMNDPAYRDELIDEMREEFPDGASSMGWEDRSLYDLAMHLQAQQLRLGKMRTKLEEAEDRQMRRARRNLRKIHDSEAGLKELSEEELARLLGDLPSLEEEQRINRRRRIAFLQREAGYLLDLRKQVALTEDLKKKADLVQTHKDAMKSLADKLGHAPGHLDQLNAVWEKEDGLVGIRFDPKTFFRLHDINSDDKLDKLEIQAIMELEARELHYDDMERITDELAVKEEVHRMQETMLQEFDDNKDTLIDLQEFLTYAETEGFIEDRAWHAVNPEQELLDAMAGQNIEDLSNQDLSSFRKDPLKWLGEKFGF